MRGQALSILGHSNFAVPVSERRAAFTRMVRHAAAGELTAAVETVALEDAAAAWERQRGGRRPSS
ncbi:MAG: hypothetical protein WKF40_07925 [Thermoleophilaceae bacterium]